MQASIVATTLLSACRLVKIKFDFFRIKLSVIVSVYVSALLIQLIALLTMTFPIFVPTEELIFIKYGLVVISSDVNNITIKVGIFLQAYDITIVFAGLAASGLTLIVLQTKDTASEATNEKLKKSMKAILLMNIYNVILTVASAMTLKYQLELPILYFMNVVGFSALGSVFNPVFRLSLCPEMTLFVEQTVKTMHRKYMASTHRKEAEARL